MAVGGRGRAGGGWAGWRLVAGGSLADSSRTDAKNYIATRRRWNGRILPKGEVGMREVVWLCDVVQERDMRCAFALPCPGGNPLGNHSEATMHVSSSSGALSRRHAVSVPPTDKLYSTCSLVLATPSPLLHDTTPHAYFCLVFLCIPSSPAPAQSSLAPSSQPLALAASGY